MATEKIETINAEIEKTKTEIRQLENRQKQLIQKQKEQERKDRTRRLCQRMGLFESMLPDAVNLSDEQFKSFLEKTIATEHSRRILDGLRARDAKTAANPTHTAQGSGADESGDGGNVGSAAV